MTDNTDTVDQLILDHLADAELPEAAESLIFAALSGADDFAAALGGAPPRRPQPAGTDTDTAEPVGTYLDTIEVTGFRGIGPTATLNLTPGPGLTVVTGRNGSGKSSFAEAAELALTGRNMRWHGRTSVWKDGWRNLHTTDDPRIRVRLGVEGRRGGTTVEYHWAGDAELTGHTSFMQTYGDPRQPVTDLGWEQPLSLYRPFLSYSELGGLLGGSPSEMHDSLQRILGLGRLIEIETLLKTARREADQRRKAATLALPELKAALAAHPDPRARTAEQALTGQRADLEQLASLVTSDAAPDDANVEPLRQIDVLPVPNRDDVTAAVDRLRDGLDRVADLADTPAAQARELAALLRDALRHRENHPDQPCPVCGGRTLDEAWVSEATTALRQLTDQAEHLDAAHRAVRDARQALRRQLPTLPPAFTVDLTSEQVDTAPARAAWQAWDDLLTAVDATAIVDGAGSAYDALVGAVIPAQAAARAALDRRRQAWQPLADLIGTWTGTARDSWEAAATYTALQTAIRAMQRISAQIRNARLTPVATEATRIWNMLRQDSNVELGSITLAGNGTQRRVDLDVAVDGVPGAALGVMSQGELHSLGLALFLPRATMPESPFRFLVIDDPVQSMDPAKVYGLAQVLADVAKRRQVVVFTHDDRLPAAVRHLGIPARILAVARHTCSKVVVTGGRDASPADRYLTDADAITKDRDMVDTVRRTIVCNQIRQALESACHERVYVAGLRSGTSVAETEAAIGEAEGLRPTLALALLGDRKRVDDLTAELRRLDQAAPRVVRAANTGAHGTDPGPLADLVDDARRIVRKLSPR
ncbi:AAA family ATPase [Solwaraspora sp. WMMD792]|uniref:AAA family ATPase n=1 Tax=Solwaraspora sp. WMMD792 TaxID=3016099 RepID=UPI0024171F52|nr:AAA family ATPase [Solwaraspora sp. WMMD792]MDG4774969.1 AAA family ATPase [Solwaraspora sp. WMMD792]